MTTVVNTPSSDTSGGAGWAVAVVIILVVLIGGYLAWAHFGGHTSSGPSANINVNLPSGGGSAGGGSAGGSGGQ